MAPGAMGDAGAMLRLQSNFDSSRHECELLPGLVEMVSMSLWTAWPGGAHWKREKTVVEGAARQTCQAVRVPQCSLSLSQDSENGLVQLDDKTMPLEMQW